MKELFTTIVNKTETFTWFCGCGISSDQSRYQMDDWLSMDDHEKYFDKEAKTMNYICHDKGKIKEEKYHVVV